MACKFTTDIFFSPHTLRHKVCVPFVEVLHDAQLLSFVSLICHFHILVKSGDFYNPFWDMNVCWWILPVFLLQYKKNTGIMGSCCLLLGSNS